MKKLLLVLTAVIAVAVMAGCVSSPAKQAAKDMKNLSYTDQPNGELELINETDYDLVIFAGSITRQNILGGIRSGRGGIRSFDFRSFVSTDSGAFLCRAVKVSVYKEKGGAVNDKDVIFAKLVTFGKNKSSFRITGEIGGTHRLLFENSSPYPVELRLNELNGQVLTTLPPHCKEQYVYVKPNPRGYVYYPTYLMYDKDSGKINSIVGKDEDAKASRPAAENETPETINFPMPNSKMFGARVAYLTIKNESGRSFIFRNDNTELFSQSGYAMINSGETLTFEVPSTEEGKTFRALNADFRIGDKANRFVTFFNGNPQLLKAGIEYNISVYNQNGLIKTDVENFSERSPNYDLNSQLDLE